MRNYSVNGAFSSVDDCIGKERQVDTEFRDFDDDLHNGALKFLRSASVC